MCVGLNYKDHAAESGSPIPRDPVLFSKYHTALLGHGGEIVLPAVSKKVDYEAELVIVIGKKGRNVPAASALDYVAGYTCGHDVSARDWQLEKDGKQWMAGKTFDTFAPVGPVLVTSDEVADPHNLRIQLRLNGQTMQDSSHESIDIFGGSCGGVFVADRDDRAGGSHFHGNAAGRGRGAEAAGILEAWGCLRSGD